MTCLLREQNSTPEGEDQQEGDKGAHISVWTSIAVVGQWNDAGA